MEILMDDFIQLLLIEPILYSAAQMSWVEPRLNVKKSRGWKSSNFFLRVTPLSYLQRSKIYLNFKNDKLNL